MNAYCVASEMGHLEAVRELAKDARVVRDSFALVLSCERGQLKIVRELLKDLSVDVNVTCNQGNTPLILASDKGHLQVVGELLKLAKVGCKCCKSRAQNCTHGGWSARPLGCCAQGIEA